MRNAWLAVLMALPALAGCVAPEPDALAPGSHIAYGFPVYQAPDGTVAEDAPPASPVPDQPTRLEPVAQVPGLLGGAGIAIYGAYAYVGPAGGPISVVDISDPSAPVRVGGVDAPGRDIDTIVFPGGRVILVTTGGGPEIYVVDATRPNAPELLTVIDTETPSHNLAVVSGTPILYNAPETGTITEIFDLSVPERPVRTAAWDSGHACHDITFHNDVTAPDQGSGQGRFRAYCAGVDRTMIWDTRDPLQPTIIADVPFPPQPDAQAFFSHTAFVDHDASIMVVGDEITTDCTAETALDPTPLAALVPKRTTIWFYDLADETEPALVGSLQPAQAERSCTAHFGRFIGDTDVFAIAYYRAGTLLIDASDPSAPRVADQYLPGGANTWDAWAYQGYVFTGDVLRGMDVLRIA